MPMRRFCGGTRRCSVSKPWRASALAGSALLLAACAATLRAPPVQPWMMRVGALRAIEDFTFSGRLAVSHDNEGFSAGMRWTQHGADASIDLSAPLGFGAAHIEQQADVLNVTTSRGEALTSEGARAQLRSTLGFDPPIASLRYWLLGASDPGSAAQESLDDQQRLTQLRQDGWEVDYKEYVWTQRQWLPRRLTLQRDALHLRLVVNDWRL